MAKPHDPPIVKPAPDAIIIERLEGGVFRVLGGLGPPATFLSSEWPQARINAGLRRASRQDPVWFREGPSGPLVRLDVESGLVIS